MHSNIATFFQQAGFLYRAISKSAQLISNSGTPPPREKFLYYRSLPSVSGRFHAAITVKTVANTMSKPIALRLEFSILFSL
jgi:hypothetical protein